MSYSPTTDFLALIRQVSGVARATQVPGLDYIIAALARAGLIKLYVGQTAPTTGQASTAWLKPAQPSWSAEASVFLWNAITLEYEVATPALWGNILAPNAAYVFQSVIGATGTVSAGTSLLAVQRVAPAATALVLPNLAAQFATTKPLQVVDFSTSVAGHIITLTTPDGATIMQKASWQLLSTADQLAGINLHPSPDLNSWVITP